MLNKIFGLVIILHSIQQPLQAIFLKFHPVVNNSGRRTFDMHNAPLTYINKREGFKGYRWDECEFSPLSCLLRR
uniref:Uncharacterized protein n=1 Tax=Wuchereria bancrofti TaxID=6293 RepID=A0AAF5Q2X0_WUCBA